MARGQLKLLPPAKPKLGLYLRPGRNDHTVFQQLLAEDRAVSGLVLDGRLAGRQQVLREALVDNGVHAVLDPDVMQMTTPGGTVLAGLGDLPWAPIANARAVELRGIAGRQLAERVAEAVKLGSFSAVLAPTHLLETAHDSFFAADRDVTGHLRRALDARGLDQVSIFYPLAVPASAFRDAGQRATVVEGLKSAPIDAVWLRLHPFGTATAGPIALRRYVELCWDLHRLGLPLVAEHTGTVGLALLAFGAVGGIESGVTVGETFSSSTLLKPRDATSAPFSPPPRLYLDRAGAFAPPASGNRLFESRAMIAALGCRDPGCCRRGVADMLKNPRRHFVIRRTAEVDRIGGVPPQLRANVYVADMLRPALLNIVRAARVLHELERVQHRLEGWHLTLTALATSGDLPAPLPALGQRMSPARPQPRALK